MDASPFPFSSIIWQQRKISVGQSGRAADSGFVSVLAWSSKWNRWDGQKSSEVLFKKNNIPQSCTDPSRTDAQSEEAQLFSWGGKCLQFKCFHHWATDVLVWYVREKWPSTSAFFFSPLPQDNCWDFDFNAFCVVLYFHAKILLYLNVFILLNVFKFFWLLYPRIAVIIHVAVSNFFLWKRSEKRERKKNTKTFSPATLTPFHLQYRKIDAETCFHRTCVDVWGLCKKKKKKNCIGAEQLWYFCFT